MVDGWFRLYRDGRQELLSEREQREWEGFKIHNFAIGIAPGSME